MCEFKIGDKVVELCTGDEGFVNEEHRSIQGNWWVDWKTGKDAGYCYHLNESEMRVVKSMDESLFTKEQLAYLDERYGIKKG